MFWSEDRSRIIMIDFGSAEDLTHLEIRLMQVEIDKAQRRNSHINYVGTAQYMAPECIRNKQN